MPDLFDLLQAYCDVRNRSVMADNIMTKRLRRHLDAAWATGAFNPEGSLAGLSAGAIADGIADQWDDSMYVGEDLLPYVAAWMERNL